MNNPTRPLSLLRRGLLIGAASLALVGSIAGAGTARAQAAAAPDALIKQVSTDVLEAVKADKSIKQGDLQKIMALVDTKVMPYVNFQRMTSSAVGRYWRQASPAQQKRLQDEFKTLLVRTYSGALAEVNDQTVQIKPMRGAADADEVVVRTEVRGRGDPVQLDYRLEKSTGAWKIYDVNVLGVWLVENYRNSFAQEIGANGIDGLINKLAERNKGPAAPAKKLMLVLPAAVTLAEASDALAMLVQALPREPGDRVTVDASGLQRFDSSALSVLLECRRAAQASGRGFAVRGAAPRLLQLSRLHGVEAQLFDEGAVATAGARQPAAA